MIIGIIGMTQGGTSAVAAVVRALGYPIEGLDRTLDDAELFGPEKIPQNIVQARGTRWAWKYPVAYDYTLDFSDKFIVVWRDPIARATHHRDLNAPNQTIFDEWFTITDTYRTIPKPHLHVSYEKLLTKTSETVQMIADFLEVPNNSSALRAVNHLKGYDWNKELH